MAAGKHAKANRASQPRPGPPKGAGPSQVLPYLFVGPQTTTEPSVAAAAGITHIISLGCWPKHNNNTNNDNAKGKDGGEDAGQRRRITYHHIGIQDTTSSDLSIAALLVADIIRNARRHPSLKSGGEEMQDEERQGVEKEEGDVKVLVHCMAGISRSPAVLAYYLMRDEDMSLRDALGTIARARPAMRPNDGFLRQLKDLELGLRGEETLEKVESLPLGTKERTNLLLG
ncbi:hypothetical protein PG989_013418 [Apiospora arundinis]